MKKKQQRKVYYIKAKQTEPPFLIEGRIYKATKQQINKDMQDTRYYYHIFGDEPYVGWFCWRFTVVPETEYLKQQNENLHTT